MLTSHFDTVIGTPAASVSADIAAVEAHAAAIDLQTAQLVFTTGRVNANVAAQVAVRKNTALVGFTFPMTDSTMHTPKTGLSVSLQRSVDGGALANAANAVAELSGGLYTINLAASDLNGSTITFVATATAADTQIWTIETT